MRHRWCVAAALSLAAFSFQAWVVLGLEGLPQFSKYPVAASQLLAGTLAGERALDFSPLYTLLFAVIGKYLQDPATKVLWFQSALIALTPGIFYLVVRRHFGRLPSLCGAVAFALSPSLLVAGYVFEPEALLLLLTVLFLFFAGRRSMGSLFFAGLFLTLGLLTRPSFLPLVLLAPAALWLEEGGRGRRLRLAGAFLLPVMAVIAAFSLKAGSFPPPLMNPGTVFFDGNNPLSDGSGVAYPPLVSHLAAEFPETSDYQHAVYRLAARRDTGRDLTHAGTNRFWAGKALNFITDHPGRFLAFEARKLYMLMHGYRWHDLRAAAVADGTLRARGVPTVPFALVSVLALLGLWLARERWREFFLQYCGFFSMCFLILATYASDRQRLSLLPFLHFFAVAAIASLAAKRFPLRLAAAATLIPVVLVMSRPDERMRRNRATWEGYHRERELVAAADEYQGRRDFTRALEARAQAVAWLPRTAAFGARRAELPTDPAGIAADALRVFPVVRGGDALALHGRAFLLTEAGRLEEAERILAPLAAAGGAAARDAKLLLAETVSRRGDTGEAWRLLRDQLEANPGAPEVLAALAALDGGEKYAALLRRYFDEGDALYFLGHAYLKFGKPGAAVDAFRRLTVLFPEYGEGRIFLAAALSDAGRSREAVTSFREAMKKNSDPVYFPGKILAAFRAEAEAAPPDGEARYWYAKALRLYGRFAEARAMLEPLLAATGKKAVADELRDLDTLLRSAGGQT
jgi:tetratricopeptide (TPR) repeat protein